MSLRKSDGVSDQSANLPHLGEDVASVVKGRELFLRLRKLFLFSDVLEDLEPAAEAAFGLGVGFLR